MWLEFALIWYLLPQREGIWVICCWSRPRLKLLDRAHLAILLVRSKFADRRAGQSRGWSEDQGYHGAGGTLRSDPCRLPPKLLLICPKFKGWSPGQRNPGTSQHPKISGSFHVESNSVSLPIYFRYGHFSMKWGGGVPFQTRPFSLGQLPSLLLSLQCTSLANWSHDLIRSI